MTTPANFNTPKRLIEFAMENAGMLQEGSTPNSEQLAKYMVRLNDLVNLWQTQGLKLWLNRLLTLTLTAGTQSYTLGPGGAIQAGKEMRILEGYFNDQNNVTRPLDVMAWKDWNGLSNKTQQGTVNSYFVDKQQLNTVIWLWLVPDATAALGNCQFLVQDPVTNSVSLNDVVGFPQEWFIALHWGLACEICTGQPQAIIDRCELKAKMYRESLDGWDTEDAPTKFAPSMDTVIPLFR